MVKRGPHGRPQASEGEAQHGPFARLDVSVKDTSVCIVDDTGKIVRGVDHDRSLPWRKNQHCLDCCDAHSTSVVGPGWAACKAQPSSTSTAAAGAPSTFNVLFCRDLVAQADGVATAVRARPAPTGGAGPRFGI